MNIFLYIMIFIAGTVFGSFFSLAVYRIPRKENITYVQSHCVNCNHKLSILDLIPIWSYVFLGGKCRYCKEKIRSRYIILEITSGLTFVLIALALKITYLSSITSFLNLFLAYLYIVAVFIIGAIDKENKMIPNSVLIYSFIIGGLKILYNICLDISIIDNLLGLLVISGILLIINLIYKKKKGKEIIYLGLIKYISSLGLFLGLKLQILEILITGIIELFGKLFHKKEDVSFGYYMSIAFVILFFAINVCA